MNKKYWIAALAAGFCAPALAAEGVYGGLMASSFLRDPNLQTEAGYGGQIFLGGPLTEALNLEGSIYMGRNSLSGAAGAIPSSGLGLDLTYELSQKGLRPFLLGGAGVNRDNLNDLGLGKTDSPYIDLGAGILVPLKPALALRAEARTYVIQYKQFPGDNTAIDFRINLGLVFGGSAPAPVAVAAAPAAAAPPRAAAAPAAPAPVAPPAKPARVAVGKCTKAPAGYPLDENGCPDLDKVELKGVSFATGSAKLNPSASQILDAVVSTLKVYPGISVDINGYTDSVGADNNNLVLSKKRAESVKAYLTAKGIAADRLSASGFGEANPVDTNDTPAGRANNRRVTFKVK